LTIALPHLHAAPVSRACAEVNAGQVHVQHLLPVLTSSSSAAPRPAMPAFATMTPSGPSAGPLHCAFHVLFAADVHLPECDLRPRLKPIDHPGPIAGDVCHEHTRPVLRSVAVARPMSRFGDDRDLVTNAWDLPPSSQVIQQPPDGPWGTGRLRPAHRSGSEPRNPRNRRRYGKSGAKRRRVCQPHPPKR
jgi:hypothetical protein